jgi:hypothetical protein
MKKIIFALILIGGAFSLAATKSPAGAAGTTTEHNFEDMLVQGKFHFSDEAVTTVEEDKVLDSLIGVRKDFKDRLSLSTNQF